jgi:hypothetical protein
MVKTILHSLEYSSKNSKKISIRKSFKNIAINLIWQLSTCLLPCIFRFFWNLWLPKGRRYWSDQSQSPNISVSEWVIDTKEFISGTMMDRILLKSRHIRCLPDITKEHKSSEEKINRISQKSQFASTMFLPFLKT